MAKLKTFPHYTIEVKDESVTFPFIPEILPLHRPMFMGFAEKGIPNVPVYGSYDELRVVFGEGTFDEYSKWFKHPNLFAKKALQWQRAFFVRLVPDDAKTADRVICLEVYESGGKKYLKWVVKTVDEVKALIGNTTLTYKTLTTYNSSTDIDGTIVNGIGYPIIALQATSPGEWANQAGIILFFDPESDINLMQNIGSILFSFGFVEQPYGYDNPIPVRTVFQDKFFEFSFNPDAVDKNTSIRYGMEERLYKLFDSFGIIRPFDVFVYSENYKTVANEILTVENGNELADGNPWMVNLITCKYLDGTSYTNVLLTDDSEIFTQDVIIYGQGGADGTLDYSTLENLTKSYVDGTIYPDIQDNARYPVTHIYDSGYSVQTKKDLLNIFNIRDDIKVVLGTQDISVDNQHDIHINTKEEDISIGSSLRAQALLHPESFIYGTPACRVSIYMQCGKPTDNPNWKTVVPATYDNLDKRCRFHNAPYVKGVPKKLPLSEVSTLTDYNWTPVTDDIKQLSWDNGLNYFQYYDRTSVHYADMRSVYPYDTSLLSSDWFVDYIVYIKHIVREEWSKFAGAEDPLPDLMKNIKETIETRVRNTLNGFIGGFTANVYQTELDKQLGYSLTIDCAIKGYMPNRIWNVIIRVQRA